ncbi:MAG: tetratricopeptide repeat protein [Myxococcota bacterium]|nr:tetratricopeptide repeat protein [Myxococcota bacterium]
MERDVLISRIALPLLLVVATLAVYLQSLGFDFIAFDDDRYILRNPEIQNGLTLESARWAFTTGYEGAWQPLTWMSFMLDFELFGLEPAGYHATNVLFHVLNTLLVYAVFFFLTRRPLPSAAVAALFGLHPLHVESVAWVAERKDVLSGFFGLLSLWAYGAYARGRQRSGYLLLSLLALALGLMSKPMLVTLPFLFLLLDYWPLGRFPALLGREESDEPRVENPGIFGPWTILVEKIPFFLLIGAASWTALRVHENLGALELTVLVPLHLRIANAIVSYAIYAAKAVVPMNLGLFYPHPYLETTGGEPWSFFAIAGASIVLLVVTGVAVAWARRAPYVIVGWLWFLGSLVPTIGLVAFGTHGMADRFTYLPLVGLAVAVAFGLDAIATHWVTRRPPLARPLGAAALSVLLAYGVAGAWQTRHWKDSISIFSHTLEASPRSAVIHFNLANELKAARRTEAAIRHYRNAVDIHPGYNRARFNMANTLRSRGDADGAIAESRLLVLRDPGFTRAVFALAATLESEGRLVDALDVYEAAARRLPGFRPYRDNGARLREQIEKDSPLN